MKTIEEIKAAVNAHIERICEGGKQPKFYWGGVWMREGAAMYSLVIPSMLSAGGYVGDLPDVAIQILYALLGLEAAEAVDSANKEIERLRALLPSAQEARQVIGLANHTIEQLRSSLDSEKARSAKLVEALMKARSDRGSTYPQNNVWNICTNAIEAHKKGEVGV